jgi:hypothetical protein
MMESAEIAGPGKKEELMQRMIALTGYRGAALHHWAILRNGEQFYAAELAAIAAARISIDLEAYIFHDTAIGRRFLQALTDRAQAGVRVRVIVDAVGSMLTMNAFFAPLRRAGGQVAWHAPCVGATPAVSTIAITGSCWSLTASGHLSAAPALMTNGIGMPLEQERGATRSHGSTDLSHPTCSGRSPPAGWPPLAPQLTAEHPWRRLLQWTA